MTLERKPDAGFASLPPDERKEAIERIIEAAGKEPDDRDRLAADIEGVANDYAETLGWKAASSGETQKRAKRVAESLEQLMKDIDSDPSLKSFIGIDELLPVLKRVLAFAEWQRMRDREKKRRPGDSEKKRRKDYPSTPMEWLVGIKLAEIYERRFGDRAKYSRSRVANTPHGPTIFFIEATLAELGLHYDRHSIGRAITALKGVRPWQQYQVRQISRYKNNSA